jgi:nitrogen fixation protein FixH
MRAARLWPLGLVAALAVTVGANVVAWYLALAPGAAVVEPGYYRKAVSMDSTLAQERRSARMGWSLEARIDPPTEAGTPVVARLADRAGLPIEGASVRLTALHNRDAAHPVQAVLGPAGGGIYGARLPLGHPGLWELRFDVARGGERFSRTLRREAPGRVRGGARP